MTRLRRALVPALVLALVPALPAAAAPDRHGAPVLLALGDSVAEGVGAVPKVSGYPELVAGLLETQGYNVAAGKATPNTATGFDVVNLAVRGARATGDLPTDLAAQVGRAVPLIKARQADRDPKNDVEVVTLTIGGNDLFLPVLAACLGVVPPGTCQAVASGQLAQVSAAVEDALRRLTAAAGKHTEIVITTYYNSLVAPCPLVPEPARALAQRLAEVVLEGGTFGGLTVQTGLNEVIEQAAARTGAQVADIHGDVGVDDLVGDCLHPDADGHVTIAEQVYATLAG